MAAAHKLALRNRQGMSGTQGGTAQTAHAFAAVGADAAILRINLLGIKRALARAHATFNA